MFPAIRTNKYSASNNNIQLQNSMVSEMFKNEYPIIDWYFLDKDRKLIFDSNLPYIIFDSQAIIFDADHGYDELFREDLNRIFIGPYKMHLYVRPEMEQQDLKKPAIDETRELTAYLCIDLLRIQGFLDFVSIGDIFMYDHTEYEVVTIKRARYYLNSNQAFYLEIKADRYRPVDRTYNHTDDGYGL